MEYHNLSRPFEIFTHAQLLIGMSMDNSKYLYILYNFAYIIRAGGAHLRYSEFKISFAISVGGVKAIALIGYNQCGLVNLISKRDLFIDGLVENAGCERGWAAEQFMHFAPMFEIGNEIDFIMSEAKRLRLRYPKIKIAPLLYRIEDNRLYLIKES